MRAAVALCALVACDWSLHRMQEQPRCSVYQPTTLLAGGTCDLAAPAGTVAVGADRVPAPPPLGRALILRGRDRFERFCAPCHGVLGDGDSAISRDMRLRRPPSLVDAPRRALTDPHILIAIDRGYGLMPAYGDALGPDDRWAVLQFVRVLQAGEEVAAW